MKKFNKTALIRILAQADENSVIESLLNIGIIHESDRYQSLWELNDLLVDLLPISESVKNFLNERIKKIIEEWIILDRKESFAHIREVLGRKRLELDFDLEQIVR